MHSFDRMPTDRPPRLLAAASLLASLLGALALLGWIARVPALSTLGEGLIPMAPSTAVLFLVFGLVTPLRNRVESGRRGAVVLRGLLGAATLVAVLLLVLSALGVDLDLEHPGLHPADAEGGVPVGHMSPLTALLFVLAGAALLLSSLRRRGQAPGLRRDALLCALVVTGGGALLAIAYVLGAPLLRGTGIIPPALPTSLAFVGLGTGIAALVVEDARESLWRLAATVVRRAAAHVAIFTVLALGVAIVTYVDFRRFTEKFRANAAQQLESVADLQVGELTRWRQERVQETELLFRNPVFAGLAREAVQGGERARAEIETLFRSIRSTYRCDRISLWDRNGVERIAVPADGREPGAPLIAAVRDAAAADRVCVLDFYPSGPDGAPRLALLAPVPPGDDGGGYAAIVSIRIDPAVGLYPRIRPLESLTRTSETLLVRRDGDRGQVLNSLRLDNNAALRLTLPLEWSHLPVARAVLGEEGVVEALDHRGKRVLAALRAVPDSPWFLVAQMDSDEIYAPLEGRLRLVGTLLVAGLLVAAAATAGLWQRREKAHFRDLYLSESARLEAERLIRDGERRFRELFEEAPVGIFVTDSVGNVLSVNPEMARIVGCDGPEAAVAHFTDLGRQLYVCPQRRAEFLRALSEEGRVEQFRYEAETADGRRAWLQTNARITNRNADGTFLIEGFTIDVTKQTEALAEQELLREQLSQVQKLESVGTLAGGVAHDFNNMLAVILGNVELALRHHAADDPALVERLASIQTAAEHSAALTRQLLAFARKQTIRPEVLDLNDIVAGMLKMLRRLIREDIDLSWRPAANLWPVKLDPTQVDQILANLVVNARDAISGVGHVIIETADVVVDEAYRRTHVEALPGEYVMLAVSDNGTGMDARTAAACFDPFFTTKPSGQGTGLGLATVYGIVRQNAGFVNVYSEVGQGTTFRVYLPRAREAPSVPETAEATPVRGGSETILIVEDNAAVLELAREILAELGYDILAANGPSAALRLAGEHAAPIALLLTDIVMPEMNGRELAAELRVARPGLNVLFMSGYTADVIAHRGVLEENVDFIQKPFQPGALPRKVRAVLDA